MSPQTSKNLDPPSVICFLTPEAKDIFESGSKSGFKIPGKVQWPGVRPIGKAQHT
jgi:hypothetical protein